MNKALRNEFLLALTTGGMSLFRKPHDDTELKTYFVKLSVGEDYGTCTFYHNINMDFEARDKMDAINKAISNAFEEASEDGAKLIQIFVGEPRLVENV